MPFKSICYIGSIIICSQLWILSGQSQGSIRCGSQSPIDYRVENVSKQAYPRSEIIIPVVFHIVWNNLQENIDEDKIYSQLQTINDDYNQNNIDIVHVPDRFQKYVGNPGLSFCLAQINPNGQVSTGIIRVQTDIKNIGGLRQDESDHNILKSSALGGSDAWDTEQYLNIWVSARSDDILGIASFPNDNTVKPHEDGIEIDYQAFGVREEPSGFNKGRTLTHEIAHYLNVDHLWGKTISCFNDGDFIDDTPEQGEVYFGCVDDEQQSCGSHDMTHNFLNFLDDECLWYFTKGQKDRMLDALYRYRFSLISSGICSDSRPIPDDPLDIAITRLTPFGFQVNLSFMPQLEYHLGLYDMKGILLWQERQNGLSIHLIETFDLPTGIYVLRLDQGTLSSIKKVFITN